MPDFARVDFGGARLCRADKFETPSTGAGFALPFDNLVRQLIGPYRRSRKMSAEQFADLRNAFDDGATEFLLLEMLAHSIDNLLPEFLSAFLVYRFIADHGEFMRPGRNENEHGIALACFIHPQSTKLFLRRDQWICLQLAALDVNANLRGSFRFGATNRAHNSLMLKPAEKLFRSHFATSSIRRRHRQSCRRHRQNH